ncbi:MAG: UDP-N-acetylmuramoyl-L-alanine--D-glutamate ligase [Clostridia bacterium]|nr:UDP-N-acetylmuramoyl-L-alanine--D-glutamate ligase [Clostridia bacterium]
MTVRDRKVLVIGMGKSGLAAAKVLAAAGAEVVVSDAKVKEELTAALQELKDWPVETVTGGYPEIKPGRFDLLVTSPGVPVWAPPLVQASTHGIPIWSEIELAYRFARGPMVAVTGTNGKTTTTALIGQMFRDAGYAASVAGNIGTPLIQEVAQQAGEHLFVVEVSSFQLEWVDRFHPRVAVLTNLTPDHLERHGTMENYLATKARIFRRQNREDYTVLNYDDPEIRELARQTQGQVIFFSSSHTLEKGVFANKGNICIGQEGNLIPVCAAQELTMPGRHNLENAMAAVAVGWAMGLTAAQMADTLRSFPGVPHRLERVAFIKGVEYINDSKGTNPESAIKALDAFQKPIILIAGGSRKGDVDFGAFAEKIQEKVRELILVGHTAPEIKETVLKTGFCRVRVVHNLEEAVKTAAGLAKPGEIVLLSPACASFDFFRNFEHRGEVFKKLVHSLV